MANVEIQNITAVLTTPATGMWIPVADGTTTKRITHANFFTDVGEIDGGKTAGEDIIIKGSTQDDGDIFLNPSGGNVSIGAGSTADEVLHAQAATDTRIKVESTGANSLAGFRIDNDAQRWSWRAAGTDSDNMQLRDETNSQSPFVVAPNSGSNQLKVTSTGVGINQSSPLSTLHIGLATEDFEVVDAGSVAATQQDWIEVEIGGVQGYIHVYAAK